MLVRGGPSTIQTGGWQGYRPWIPAPRGCKEAWLPMALRHRRDTPLRALWPGRSPSSQRLWQQGQSAARGPDGPHGRRSHQIPAVQLRNGAERVQGAHGADPSYRVTAEATIPSRPADHGRDARFVRVSYEATVQDQRQGVPRRASRAAVSACGVKLNSGDEERSSTADARPLLRRARGLPRCWTSATISRE